MRLLLPLLLLLLAGCFGGERVREAPDPAPARSPQAQAPPASHTVRRGDTLYAIARKHGVSYRDLARWNGIAPPYTIYPGQQLKLAATPARPSARPAPQRPASRPAPAPTRPASTPQRPPAGGNNRTPPATTPGTGAPAGGTQRPAATPSPSPPPTSSKPPPAATGGSWRWPTEGNVIRGFVANDPGRQGIKIAGEAGQPVIAARAGQVVYSGTGLVGYGELVIVKHDGGYLTAYGHNRRRLVQEGQQVQAGQAIAELGRSGTDREMLHFEIRVGGKPIDPLTLLPRR